MRLYQRGGQIYLDPEPLDADSLRRNARFKMTCRAYVRCVVKGHILLEEIGNYTEFEKIVGKLSKVASRLGVALSVDDDLQDGFTQVRVWETRSSAATTNTMPISQSSRRSSMPPWRVR